MSDQYPKMLFRPVAAGAENAVVVDGLSFETLVVADFDEEEDAGDDGWTRYDERDTSGADDLATASIGDAENLGAAADLLRDELLAADDKLRTRETEINLANERIAVLESENAALSEELAALKKANEPPALSGKNKAELLEIAAKEGVTVEDGATNDDIKAAIELKREAGA